MTNTITIPVSAEMIDEAIDEALREPGGIEAQGVELTGCACSPGGQTTRVRLTAEGTACECGRLFARWKGKPLVSELEMVAEPGPDVRQKEGAQMVHEQQFTERARTDDDLRRVAASYGREVPSGWSRNRVRSVLNVAGSASVKEALIAAGAPEAGADAAAKVAQRPPDGLLYEAGAGRYLDFGQLDDMMHALNAAVTSDVAEPCATRHPVCKVSCALPREHHGLCLSRVADADGRWMHWWLVGGPVVTQKGGAR